MHCLLTANRTAPTVKWRQRSFAHDIHGAHAVVSLNRPRIISGYQSHSCAHTAEQLHS